MSLNSKQHVNFKTARLLKEDGFDVPCKSFFSRMELPVSPKRKQITMAQRAALTPAPH